MTTLQRLKAIAVGCVLTIVAMIGGGLIAQGAAQSLPNIINILFTTGASIMTNVAVATGLTLTGETGAYIVFSNCCGSALGGTGSILYSTNGAANQEHVFSGKNSTPVMSVQGLAEEYSHSGLITSHSSNYTVDSSVAGGGAAEGTSICATSSADIVVTLPVVSGALITTGASRYRILQIFNTGTTNNCLITPTSTTINGQAVYILPPLGGAVIQADTSGNGWHALATTGNPVARVQLTNAQILALPTTPVQIIEAPPSGYFTKVIGVTLYANTANGAYTNLNTTYADIHAVLSTYYAMYGPVNDSTTTPALTILTTILGGTNDSIYEIGQPNQGSIPSTPGGYVINTAVPGVGSAAQPLMLSIDNNGSGNLTGGNALNYLLVVVQYRFEKITL